MMKIFTDTGVWIALADANDRYHNIAKKVYALIRKKNIPVVITDYIFDETVTWLHYKIGHDTRSVMSISILHGNFFRNMMIRNSVLQTAYHSTMGFCVIGEEDSLNSIGTKKSRKKKA